MTPLELERIKNHISNIPSVAALYVPTLIEGAEALLLQVASLQAEADKLRENVAWLEAGVTQQEQRLALLNDD